MPEDIKQQIENRFTYHPPHGTQAKRYGEIREKAKEFALFLEERCPAQTREFATALTKLDEVVFFSNASIARNEMEP